MEASVLTSGFRFKWLGRGEIRYLTEPPSDVLGALEDYLDGHSGDWELLFQDEIGRWCGIPDDPNDDIVCFMDGRWRILSSHDFDMLLS